MTLEEKLNHFMEISVQDATMEMDASLKEYQAALDAQFGFRVYIELIIFIEKQELFSHQ